MFDPEKTYNLAGVPRSNGPLSMNDAAIAGGMSFLVSELEKLDPLLRVPLTSVTYPRDIDIEVGGGWSESESAMNVDYAVSGAQGDAIVGGAANAIRIMQANLGKDIYKTFPYAIALSVKFIDVQRSNQIGRSLEQIYDDGIRLDFDKYMDINTYLGQSKYGTYGLVNHPQITATAVVNNAAGTSTIWKQKTPDEILNDINSTIVAAWSASEYDQSAVANHVLIDPANYAYIASTKVSLAADKTILEFLLDNNIAKQKGVNLFIGDCRFCTGAGVGGKNRMVVYVNQRRFVSESVLQPLGRVMTQPNVANVSYDSAYMANVGQVKFFYLEPARYADGI